MREPEIKVWIPTVENELRVIEYCLEKIQWFRENNYKIKMPNHPEFWEVFKDVPGTYQLERKARLEKIFRDEIYQEKDYYAACDELKGDLGNVQGKLIARFQAWSKGGQFKVFPRYNVSMTKYGPGGSYGIGENSAVVKVMIDNIWKRTLLQGAVHEMVHTGVNESFVTKFNLTQAQKETLVDWICQSQLQDVVPNFRMQDELDVELLKRLEGKSMDQVEEVLREYTRL